MTSAAPGSPAGVTDGPRVGFEPIVDPAAAGPTIEPMKPRYKLLGFFAFILALWIAMMAFMYAATVYPQRHPGGSLPKASVPSSDAAPTADNPAR